MRLRPERLTGHLRGDSLAPVYLISGDEPLQRFEAEDAIRACARNKGFEERTVLEVAPGFDWNALRRATSNLSLFSSKQLIELRLATQKLGKEGGQALVEYTDTCDAGKVLLISAGKIDKNTQKTVWFKTVEKAGVVLQTWPVSPGQLPEWITARFRRREKTISPEAARLIAQRVEGNLLAAKQEIDKLCLLIEGEHIDAEQAINAVTDDAARYNVFALIESAFAGQAERALRILTGLRGEGIEPIALHGAIMWEFRRVCSMACRLESGASMDSVFSHFRVWDKRRPVTAKLLQRYRAGQLQVLLNQAIRLERLIKSRARANIWDEFGWFLLAVAGVRLPTNKIRDY